MLAPEVWNFKPPSSAQQIERGKLSDAHECVDFCVSTHHFNHSVSVVIPTKEKLPQNIEAGPSAKHGYYVVKKLPVVEFVSQDFIKNFVEQGNCTALSIGTAIDCDNCVSLSPSGTLVLNLNRVDYERLGLEGKPSFFCRLKPPSKYVIKIDLTENCFKPHKKNYERVVKCLLQNLKLEMDFLIAWDPPSVNICTSSIAAYFNSLGFSVALGNSTFAQKKYMDAQVPENLTDCEAEDAFEWIGAVNIGANMASWYDSSLEFSIEDDTANISLQTLQWSGFHSSQQIEQYILLLKEYLDCNTHVPWFCLHVQGFEDSAISWKLNENFFHQSAEHSYTIIIDKEHRFLLSKILGANRKARPHSK